MISDKERLKGGREDDVNSWQKFSPDKKWKGTKKGSNIVSAENIYIFTQCLVSRTLTRQASSCSSTSSTMWRLEGRITELKLEQRMVLLPELTAIRIVWRQNP